MCLQSSITYIIRSFCPIAAVLVNEAQLSRILGCEGKLLSQKFILVICQPSIKRPSLKEVLLPPLAVPGRLFDEIQYIVFRRC